MLIPWLVMLAWSHAKNKEKCMRRKNYHQDGKIKGAAIVSRDQKVSAFTFTSQTFQPRPKLLQTVPGRKYNFTE